MRDLDEEGKISCPPTDEPRSINEHSRGGRYGLGGLHLHRFTPQGGLIQADIMDIAGQAGNLSCVC